MYLEGKYFNATLLSPSGRLQASAVLFFNYHSIHISLEKQEKSLTKNFSGIEITYVKYAEMFSLWSRKFTCNDATNYTAGNFVVELSPFIQSKSSEINSSFLVFPPFMFYKITDYVCKNYRKPVWTRETSPHYIMHSLFRPLLAMKVET